MKRIEVSTEIGSLSVTYQKQKKMLVCLSGAGLLPSYENFSLMLEKLPPTIGYLTIDFPNAGRSPIHDQSGKIWIILQMRFMKYLKNWRFLNIYFVHIV